MKRPVNQPFTVPPLTTDTVYRDLFSRQSALLEKQTKTVRERRELEQQIAEAPAPAYRPGVAELLGEDSDGQSALRARLKEVVASERDIETALEILAQRLREARTKASLVVCNAVRPEYGRRVAAIADALKAVASARAEYHQMRDELEREDIAWFSLVPMDPAFLGDARDGHIQRYLKEAKEAGYAD